jgi:hypothetical protein
VADEASSDFLEFYNPLIESVRTRVSLFPMPTLQFREWITGLIILGMALLVITPFAFRGAKWLRPLAYALAIIMILNGLGHMTASAVLGRVIPGTLSSPLLVAAAAYLFASLRWPTSPPLSEIDK